MRPSQKSVGEPNKTIKVKMPRGYGACGARIASVQTLQNLRVRLLIHTAEPFQGQGYAVAQARAKADEHYIDLADRAVLLAISQAHCTPPL